MARPQTMAQSSKDRNMGHHRSSSVPQSFPKFWFGDSVTAPLSARILDVHEPTVETWSSLEEKPNRKSAPAQFPYETRLPGPDHAITKDKPLPSSPPFSPGPLLSPFDAKGELRHGALEKMRAREFNHVQRYGPRKHPSVPKTKRWSLSKGRNSWTRLQDVSIQKHFPQKRITWLDLPDVAPQKHAPMAYEAPLEAVDEVEKAPDGGTLAWLHVLAGTLVIMNAQGLNQSYGVFQAYYEGMLLSERSPATIAWIGSIQVFLLMFMAVVVSPLIDKGHFRLCFNGGSLLLVASIIATSFCRKYWQLVVAQGLMTGAGMGLIFGSGAVVLMSYFSKRIAVATGLAASGGAIGGMLFTGVAEQLVFKIGYGWTVRVIALIVLVTLIPANLIVRQRSGSKSKGPPQMDWTMFRDLPYMFMTAGFFFSYWGIYIGYYYIVTYGQTRLHLAPTPAITLLILMNAAGLPGRLFPSFISDTCLGPFNTLIPCAFLASACLVFWIGCTTHTSVIMLAVLYGFAAGGVQSLYSACIFELATPKEGLDGAAGEAKLRVRLALVYAAIGFAVLTGSPVGGGLIVRMEGRFLGAQIFAGGSVFIGACLLVAARFAREGWAAAKV